jgi:hypothetical protein
MAQDGETIQGTPAETLARLRENPELITKTSFPHAGHDYYISYDPETDTFSDRVVTLGADLNDESAIIVGGEGQAEEEILHHIQFLIDREAMAENPMAALMAMLAGGVLDLDDEED